MRIQKYGKETSLRFYREMYKLRAFEVKASQLFMQGLMAGNIHTYIGQEAVAVGACQALKKSDLITSTHRCHGHCLAKGGDPKQMMAELFGKSTGYCKGKGGSMHIVSHEVGILGANGIVSAGIPIATGSALASMISGGKEVTLAFFGDGASNEGNFHESLNMASAWRLPVVFLCENNQYGVSVCIDNVCNIEDIADRAKAYKIPGVVVDGNDVFAVYEAVEKAVKGAREGAGPTLIEAKTARLHGHYEGDPQVYKTKERIQQEKENDPLVKFRKELLGSNLTNAEEIEAIEAEINAQIEEAVEFAKQSAYPSVDEVTTDVYAIDNERCIAR